MTEGHISSLFKKPGFRINITYSPLSASPPSPMNPNVVSVPWCLPHVGKGMTMAFIKVKNKNGTAGKTPPAGYVSWLDFWEKKKNTKATICEVMGCSSRPTLGGHVIKSGEGGKEYILPMCSACNNKPDDEEFEAWENDLVSVK